MMDVDVSPADSFRILFSTSIETSLPSCPRINGSANPRTWPVHDPPYCIFHRIDPVQIHTPSESTH